MFYLKIIKELNKHKVEYLVVGGIATNLYGVSRLTLDIDLMADIKKENFDRIFTAMKDLKYKVYKSLKVDKMEFVNGCAKLEGWKGSTIIFYNPKDELERVDLFTKNPIIFEEAYKKRETRIVEGVKVPLISFNDLLKMKEIAGREKDPRDLGYLKMARSGYGKKRKGYRLTKEDKDYLKWCSKLTDSQRLKWLEEANRFIYKACSPKIWKMRMLSRERGW
ncbi:MAG: DUF6036 family nucleotidyltransferase [Candidatus Margulisiibacteriota bacterium]|nr:DUF6036 family nucleotidyltransferase [Candidatus Margulisiibacteriota bacterium]